jgi:competence ComEA-like helix-hairpin-helix protein
MKLPKIGLLYMDYVLRFFNPSNFKGWPDKIETVTYHWGNDADRFIKEVRRKKIDVLIGNIPATAYESFRKIQEALPEVRFVPSVESQFPNKSKENVTLFCKKHRLSHPRTEIFYDTEKGFEYLESCSYPKIIKRSYGPSNYGGYYVHKVDSKEEATKLLKEKKYLPHYIQDCIPLKADIRVMLVGHRPVCAFWRQACKDQWITNTSQGGSMSYKGVDIGALELAVQSSKAAKAEFWACDIAEHDGKYYILECATAFAAFPYVRDWIGQYLMWDFSKGHFPMPHVPLYSWEELGKIDSKLLRTMRHLAFSPYTPSADGALYVTDPFTMELTEVSSPSDLPQGSYQEQIIRDEENLPEIILKEAESGNVESYEEEIKRLFLPQVTLTDLMALHGMEEEMAKELYEFLQENTVHSLDDLKQFEWIDDRLLAIWEESLVAQVDINKATKEELVSIRGIGEALAESILARRKEVGQFTDIEDLLLVEGVGQKRYESICGCFSVSSQHSKSIKLSA